MWRFIRLSFLGIAVLQADAVEMDVRGEVISPKIYRVGEPILSQPCRSLAVDEIKYSKDVLEATQVAHQVKYYGVTQC